MEKVEAEQLIKEEATKLENKLVSTFDKMVKQINHNREFVKETRDTFGGIKTWMAKMEERNNHVDDKLDDILELVKKKDNNCILHGESFQKKLDEKAGKWVEKVLIWAGAIVGGVILTALISLILKDGGV